MDFKNQTLAQKKDFLLKLSPRLHKIDIGFVPKMKVPACIIVSNDLEQLLVEELEESAPVGDVRGGEFLPALKQVAAVATLPGMVKGSFDMPDVHIGHRFSIGGVAAFDVEDPGTEVSPGGTEQNNQLGQISAHAPYGTFKLWIEI